MAERTVKHRRDGSYYRKDRKQWYVSYINAEGKRVREPAEGAENWKQAQTYRSDKLREVREIRNLKPGELLPCNDTFKTIAERYLKHQKSRITPHSYQRESEIIGHLKGFFGDKKLNVITAVDCSAYVTHRLTQVTKSTTRKELNVLKHLYKLVTVEWALLPRYANPTVGVSSPEPNDERSQYLEPDQFLHVLKAAPEDMRPIFGLLGSTGMRRGELLGCRWGYIHENYIALPTSKNGESKIVHLNNFSQEILDSIPHGRSNDLLFPNAKPTAVSVAFLRTCQSLGIEDRRLHDLRHSFGTWMRWQGAELDTIAAQLGHKDLRQTRRYAKVAPRQVAQSVTKVDTLLNGEETAKTPIASHRLVTADNKLLPAKSAIN